MSRKRLACLRGLTDAGPPRPSCIVLFICPSAGHPLVRLSAPGATVTVPSDVLEVLQMDTGECPTSTLVLMSGVSSRVLCQTLPLLSQLALS